MLKFTTLSLALAFALHTLPTAHAVDTESSPAKNASSADYVAGKQAVENKDWALAAASFRRATLQDPKNADAWNMLGYSSRWAGKYPEAFDAYARALALEPLHRGANSYLGVAYVRTNDLVKARAQLAKLESICGNKDCDEYKALDKAIIEYKPK
jgi:Flp pilus assembly protein TadD